MCTAENLVLAGTSVRLRTSGATYYYYYYFIFIISLSTFVSKLQQVLNN